MSGGGDHPHRCALRADRACGAGPVAPRAASICWSASLIFVAAALLPVFNTGYWLSIGVSIAMFTVLATSWTLFSGPTNYISLATAAFFGIGMYIVGGGLTYLPFPVLVAGRGGRRRAVRRRGRPRDAAHLRRLFRHLHARPRRTGAADRGLGASTSWAPAAGSMC